MDNLKGKVVTVFGGSGFVGRYVVRDLAEAGYTVKVVTRNPEYAKSTKTSGFVGQVVPIKGDIRDYDNLQKMVAGSYAVVNLIGILHESGKQKFRTIHSEAAEKLALAAKGTAVKKFIHMSALVDVESASEYAQSKLDGERAVTNVFPDAVIFKPSVIFGPEDNFFNMFARVTSFSPFLPLIGGGKNKFQPVYVGDVALAIAKAIDSNDVKPGAYQLGGPEALSFRNLMERVLKYIDRNRILLPVPYSLAGIFAMFTPSCILTRDQVKLLKKDNVVTSRTRTFTELGIEPTAIDAIVPKYLAYYISDKTLPVS